MPIFLKLFGHWSFLFLLLSFAPDLLERDSIWVIFSLLAFRGFDHAVDWAIVFAIWKFLNNSLSVAPEIYLCSDFTLINLWHSHNSVPFAVSYFILGLFFISITKGGEFLLQYLSRFRGVWLPIELVFLAVLSFLFLLEQWFYGIVFLSFLYFLIFCLLVLCFLIVFVCC
jgi:hypothetical protein